MPGIIMCIDMDAFFASVEQQSNPNLRGKPVAVIGSGGRTVVVTRSYEARKFGVKTGMNIYEARKACPHLIFVTANNEKYTHTCSELTCIYARFTPEVEVYSIDEAFLDVTTTHHLFGGPEEIGAGIKKEIRNLFGINCTVGIGPNVQISKLVSDLGKPDGLVRVKEEEVPELLEALPVDKLWGIASGTREKLEAIGIRTCGELGRAPAGLLRSRFGIIGEVLKAMGTGTWERPLLVQEPEPKSIGHSMTLPRDVAERKEIETHILKLSEMVGRRARKYGFTGKTVSLTLRYRDFDTFTRRISFPEATNSTHAVYRHAVSILSGIRLRDRVRLVGVCLSCLSREGGQLGLFQDEGKTRNLFRAIDEINDRHGDFTVTWGAYLNRREPPSVISPAWRPSGVRNVKIR